MEKGITRRDYFAGQAMLAVMQETQEVVPASFFDWVKHLLFNHAGATFLTVRYKEIEGIYEEAAKRAHKYADAMMQTCTYQS